MFFRLDLILLLSVLAANSAPVNKLGEEEDAGGFITARPALDKLLPPNGLKNSFVMKEMKESTNDLVCTWVLCFMCWVGLIARQGEMEPNWNRV